MLAALVRDITVPFNGELQLSGAWVESPTSVCFVYRRTIDADLIFGRRVTFPPHAIADNPSSTGADIAQSLLEPSGDAMERARLADGVNWLWVQPEEPTPMWLGARPSCPPFPRPRQIRPAGGPENVGGVEKHEFMTFPDWQEPASLLRRGTGPAASHQLTLAEQIGYEVDATAPFGVVAARLEAFLGPKYAGTAGTPLPPTDSQVRFFCHSTPFSFFEVRVTPRFPHGSTIT